MKNTHKLIQIALSSINDMYGPLEDLHEILSELINDPSIDFDSRYALEECRSCLNNVYLLDELAARLGCIDTEEENN